jgi:hypothetical protein
MLSRKTLLLGTGALVLVAFVLVRTIGGGPSPTVERGDGSQFPLRGSLAGDRGAIDDALDAWKAHRGGPGRSRTARVSDADVHLLYAGRIGNGGVVLIRQGDRLIKVQEDTGRGWYVGAATEDFDPFDGVPVAIGGVVLLPAGGDWRYLPLRARGERPLTVDGLVGTGWDLGDLDPGMVIEDIQPVRNRLTKVFDTTAGLFNVDPESQRRIVDASRHPGELMAIHAALGDDRRVFSGFRSLDVLWTGRLPSVRQAAVVARSDADRLGLGLVRDPDDLVSSAESVGLGSRTSPLGAARRDSPDPPWVGAAYVGGVASQPESLIAAATPAIDRIEFLVGTRRFTRSGPVAIVPVGWDAQKTDAVVVGRTRGGAVIAPLVPQSP